MKLYLYSILIGVLPVMALHAQGCSDAGICSIGAHYDEMDTTKNRIEVSTVFGAGEADVKYISPYVAYTRTFNAKWAGSVKITSSYATGSFGERASVGDAFLTTNYKPQTEKVLQFSYTAGAKIPFNRANLKINDHPLPLDYQTSLGTFDFLGSINASYRQWDFNAAVQIPVFNINANSYIKEFSGTDDFVTTNLFERKPDALLRGTYTITANKFTFKPNLLFIYHLGEDTYEDIFGQRQSIDGSSGLTLNGNLISAYNFKSGTLELSLATPFVVREERPDGLTRAWTAAIGYSIRF
ncbi:hypothetical protein GWA97_11485 [Flavobacterium sp. LaA7.5]|nr:hypothetical protein [Flavobacterium salilacus subsp. altitudinum]